MGAGYATRNKQRVNCVGNRQSCGPGKIKIIQRKRDGIQAVLFNQSSTQKIRSRYLA